MPRKPHNSGRPQLPMSLPPETRVEGALRLIRAEDTIVSEPGMEVSLAAAVAAGAISRMDAELHPLREGGGPKPYVFDIFDHERLMVETLTRDPPTAQVAERASSILDRLSGSTTCDELAVAAVGAANWYRITARGLKSAAHSSPA